MSAVQIRPGDCRETLRAMVASGEQVDSIVCDPPYGIDYLSAAWDTPDNIAFDRTFWELCLKVLKPGGHLVAFSASRTYHRLVCAVEDAGFEVRDRIRFECSPETKYGAFVDGLTDEQRSVLAELLNDQTGTELSWTTAKGFPKNHDVSKALDKSAGAVRTERLGVKPGHEKLVGVDNVKGFRDGEGSTRGGYSRPWMSDPKAVEDSHYELAPVTDEAKAWKGWGTALKPAHEPILLARKPLDGTVAANVRKHGVGGLNVDACRVPTQGEDNPSIARRKGATNHLRTHKAADSNAVGKMVNRAFPETYQADREGEHLGRFPANVVHDGSEVVLSGFPDAKAARFFYSAKASKEDRCGSKHPTVKPLSLMQWLVRMVTPKGGLVLDPFAGSGTTGAAAMREGCRAILCEREVEFLADIERRIASEPATIEGQVITATGEAPVTPSGRLTFSGETDLLKLLS